MSETIDKNGTRRLGGTKVHMHTCTEGARRGQGWRVAGATSREHAGGGGRAHLDGRPCGPVAEDEVAAVGGDVLAQGVGRPLAREEALDDEIQGEVHQRPVEEEVEDHLRRAAARVDMQMAFGGGGEAAAASSTAWRLSRALGEYSGRLWHARTCAGAALEPCRPLQAGRRRAPAPRVNGAALALDTIIGSVFAAPKMAG